MTDARATSVFVEEWTAAATTIPFRALATSVFVEEWTGTIAPVVIVPVSPDTPSPSAVRRLASDYALAWADLLPQGSAWSRDPNSVIQTTIGGLAGIWGSSTPTSAIAAVSVDGRAADLLGVESDPRQTVELLSDWERAFGLPDLCVSEPLTIADRQKALVARIAFTGGQSRAWFLAYAALIGYAVSIIERAPFMCGISRCGGTVGETAENPIWRRWEIGPANLRSWWTVKVRAARLTWFRCGGGGGRVGVDPMLTIGFATDLECAFRRYKPAHTVLTFDYSGLTPLSPFEGTP